METKDMVIVGLVVLLVLAVVFSLNNFETTGKMIDISCTDNDGGYNVYEKGQISGTDSTGVAYGLGTNDIKEDYCAAASEREISKELVEYKCNIGQGDPGWVRSVVDCSATNPNSICVDGACTQ